VDWSPSRLFDKFCDIHLLKRVTVLFTLDSGFRRNDAELGLFVIPLSYPVRDKLQPESVKP
jgi:hypothetical protein